MATVLELINGYLADNKEMSPAQKEGERQVMVRLVENPDLRHAYTRGVGTGNRTLTPSEAWAIQVGLDVDRARNGGNPALARQAVVGQRFTVKQTIPDDFADTLRARWNDPARPSGYRFTGGFAGDSYANVRGAPSSNALSDALLSK